MCGFLFLGDKTFFLRLIKNIKPVDLYGIAQEIVGYFLWFVFIEQAHVLYLFFFVYDFLLFLLFFTEICIPTSSSGILRHCIKWLETDFVSVVFHGIAQVIEPKYISLQKNFSVCSPGRFRKKKHRNKINLLSANYWRICSFSDVKQISVRSPGQFRKKPQKQIQLIVSKLSTHLQLFWSERNFGSISWSQATGASTSGDTDTGRILRYWTASRQCLLSNPTL